MVMRRRIGRKTGFTLMLTLFALVVLATLSVQYQADTAVHARSSSFRREKTQCRYAAESGIIAGIMLVQQAIKEQAEKIRDSRTAAASGEQTTTDAAAGLDLNDWEDPNVTEYLEQQERSFVIKEETIQVGEAEVTLEIHDESAKWPVMWVFASPFGAGTSSVKPDTQVANLGESLDLESEVAELAMDLIREIGKPASLPPAEFTITLSRGRSSVSTNSRLRGRSTSSSVVTRRRHLGYTKRVEEGDQRRESMGEFAKQLQHELHYNSEYSFLKEPLFEDGDRFVDYLGPWGHNKININTAPKRVMLAAFSGLGFTESMAEAVVSRRETMMFASTSELRELALIDDDVRSKVTPLCTTGSDTFSVHVTARLGRTSMKLNAGVYRNTTGKLKTAAINPGD